MRQGELAIVLHTHMPYVEGFGTWPFGEEWLWEAAATSYVPLLRVLDGMGPEQSRTKLTVSLTPVLCDQLEAPGAIERCIAFLRDVRPESHRLDIEGLARSGTDVGLTARAIAELERSAAEYASASGAVERLEQDGGLMQALGRHATWTSAATHAILPLLAMDASIDLQLQVGIDSHRKRFAGWGGGFWLPECAHAPWLNGLLKEAGVHRACVELTRLLGHGDARNLTPRRPKDGPTLLPIDRAIIELVWGEDGYPSRPPYRDYHHLTRYGHRVRANDGGVYDHDRARVQAAADARDFVSAVRERVAHGGLCICALDTELLGHWWYEGPLWLEAVIEEAELQGLALTALSPEALERHNPVQADIPDCLPATSWGAGGDLRTWSEPTVADLVWQTRGAELHAFLRDTQPSPLRALRELMALQSSDWAFLAHRAWAGDYPRQRASGHAASLSRALQGESDTPYVRNLAPYMNGYS